MSSRSFFSVEPTADPLRWRLPLTARLCMGPPDRLGMWGGVGLGAAIEAMERAFGKPAAWATGQFAAAAQVPQVLELEITPLAQGRQVVQARLIGHVGEREVLAVSAALGERALPIAHQGFAVPDVPPPEACEPARHWGLEGAPDVHRRIECRVAAGGYARARAPQLGKTPGRVALWLRALEPEVRLDAGLLAVLADFAPSCMDDALGRRSSGGSLDNTIRYAAVQPTPWVLCDITLDAAHAGFGHSTSRLFAQDGALMAVATQTVTIRVYD